MHCQHEGFIIKTSINDNTAFESSFIGELLNKSDGHSYCAPKHQFTRQTTSQSSSEKSSSLQNSQEVSRNDSEEALTHVSESIMENKEYQTERSSLLSSTYLLTLLYFIIGNLA